MKSTPIHPLLKNLYCADQTQVEMVLARRVNDQHIENVFTGPPPVLTFTRLLFGDPDVDAQPKILYCITSNN